MARTEITIQLPTVTNKAPLAVKAVTPTSLDTTNGMKLKKAAECMRNTLQLHLNASAAGTIVFKAGDNYPNALRGDTAALPLASGVNVILIQDPSQFTNKDGSICFDLSTGLTGTVYASAKPTGIGQ